MSRGKIDTDSKRATTDNKNQNIKNTVFDSKRLVSLFEEEEKRKKNEAEGTNKCVRKKPHFYARYSTNQCGHVLLTRTPESLTDREARKKFKNLVDSYEKDNELSLSDLSKRLIMCRMLENIEEYNAFINIKDEARQFLSYRFEFLDAVWIYLFKVFYPQMFDYEFLNDDNRCVKFHSQYIENNFHTIFKDVDILTRTIIYDSIIIAIENYLLKQIESINEYKIEIHPCNNIENLKMHLDNQLNHDDPRIKLIKYLKPSIIFLTMYYHNIDEGRHDDSIDFVKKITSILNQQVFYEGSRGDKSRGALVKTYQECREMLESITDPLTKLLNLHYMNKVTHIYDFEIIKENIEFAPYAFNGIISKYHIDKMIVENNEKLNRPTSENFELSSVCNNANCIIYNISSRDYEIIDFLITRSANTIYEYYLKDGNSDIPPSQCESLIKAISKDGYVGDMLKFIKHNNLYEINRVDYALVKNFKSDEMKG